MNGVTSILRTAPAGRTVQRLFTHHCTHEAHPRKAASSSLLLAHRPKTPISSATPRRLRRRTLSTTVRSQQQQQPGDNPNFTSIVDNPPELVRAGGRRHGPGIIILAIIPVTAFLLGCWQVQRLSWKTDLIARSEDRLVRDPLPLPPRVDPDAIRDFDFRRVYTRGHFRHEQEMLIGPRVRDGEQGFMVVTPFEPVVEEGGGAAAAPPVLVNRGWIAKKFRDPRSRPEALPRGEVVVEGLLREPWKKNLFTPDNKPERGEFYFPDVEQMAKLTGSQAVWVEQTMEPDYDVLLYMESHGVPIGRAAEVNLRNNHAQYIFTWYSLSLATSIMLWMVIKKPPSDIAKRVRMNKSW